MIRRGWIGLAVLVGLASILIYFNKIPLQEPDEGRNAEVAREMRLAGDWVVPRFHGMPYLDKPVLYFDAVAASFLCFGSSEGAARLPSLGFALATGAATWLLGRRLLGRGRAAGAIGVLFTLPLFVLFARTVIFDMALAFFVVLSLYLAMEGRDGWRWGYPLAWIATGLAVLTKGPIGLLLPILGTVAMAIGLGRPWKLGRFFHPLHVALFLAMCLPWVLAVEARHPGFLRYALLIETVERLTRPTFHRTGPIYYYLPILILGLFPWSLAALARLPAWIRSVRGLAAPSPERGLLLASAAIVVFFSLSSSKLGGYVLPAVPLLAILVGADAARAGERPGAWAVAPGIVLCGIGAALLGAVLARMPLARWLHQPQELGVPVRALIARIGFVAGGAGLLLLLAGLARRATYAPALLALCFPCMLLCGAGPLLAYAEQNSSRQLASVLREEGGEGAQVVAVRCFPVSLDFYLGRVVPVVTRTGSELTSTYVTRNLDTAHRDAGGGLMTPEELARLLAGGAAPVLITRTDAPPAPGYLMAARVRGYRIWKR